MYFGHEECKHQIITDALFFQWSLADDVHLCIVCSCVLVWTCSIC